MKSTGIVRKLDELGRIVIPMELRKTLDLKEKDPVEIFVQGENIIFRKYKPGCHFCGNVDRPIVKQLYGKLVCGGCFNLITKK